MRLDLVSISSQLRSRQMDSLVNEYVSRLEPYVSAASPVFKSTHAFLESLDRQKSRTEAVLVLLDNRGKQLSSEELARWIGRMRDEGRQRIVFAIGPADGWTDADRQRAGLLLSLGPMTLPHELARVVLSEQVYRAFTILAGHPYHTGH
jgi:23S rRNA (pseudouridine1915-N3)-methyltransferase